MFHYPLHSFFYKTQYNWPLCLLFLKFSWFLGFIVLNLLLFSSVFFCFFLIFHNTVMIYNTRDRNNDTTERKKKDLFWCSCRRKLKLDCPMYSKQTHLKGVYSWNKNKMWSLKSLVMLKCGSRTSSHTI